MPEPRVSLGQVLLVREEMEAVMRSRYASPRLNELLTMTLRIIDEVIERREKEALHADS